MSTIKRLVLLFILLLLSVGVVTSNDYLVANSHDWHSLYLSAQYAKRINASFIYFENLADSQVKIATIPNSASILVFESKNKPVVKNLESFFKTNDFNSFHTIYYEDYNDLQDFIVDQLNPEKLFLLNSDYALIAVAASPYIVKHNYQAVFVNKNNVKSVVKLAKHRQSIVAGLLPFNEFSNINARLILGGPNSVLKQVTKMSYDSSDSDWGELARIDLVDLTLLSTTNPIFLFYSKVYLDDLINMIIDSGIHNFEVINGATSDIAKSIKSNLPYESHFLLKYGKTVTGIDELEGKIMNLDSITMPYPKESLSFVNATFYPKMNTLVVSYKNSGNIDILEYSNIEFRKSADSDGVPNNIRVGEIKSIPYKVDFPEGDSNTLILATKFGFELPLKNTLSNSKHFYLTNVSVSNYYENITSPNLISAFMNFDRNKLELDFVNDNDVSVKIFAELLINNGNRVFSSSVVEIPAHSKKKVLIDTRYVYNSDLSEKSVPVKLFYGHKDIFNKKTVDVQLNKYSPKITAMLLSFAVNNLWLLIIIILVVLFIIAYRHYFAKKKHKPVKKARKSRRKHKN